MEVYYSQAGRRHLPIEGTGLGRQLENVNGTPFDARWADAKFIQIPVLVKCFQF